MNSFPLIETSLSDTQLWFTCFVERYATDRDALYEADGDSSLLGDTVKVTVTSNATADDVSERHHTVEFMSLGGDGHWQSVGRISHSTKQIEAMQGSSLQIESTFEIAGPGIPDGRFGHADVEQVVQAQLDKLRAARLLPLRARRPGRSIAPEACAA
jgi:hypothetical protein